MYCGNCGAPLPPGAMACPQCGTRTASYFTNSGGSPDDPTFESSSSGTPQPMPSADYGPPQPMPSTDYGSQPYDPYSITPPPPPPPVLPSLPPQRPVKRKRTGIIVAGLLLLLLAAAAIFVLISRPANPTAKVPPTPQATTSTAPTSPPSNTLANPYSPGSGTLALNDPLSDNSKGYTWDEGQPYSGTTCAFTGGAYQVSITQAGIAPCTATSTDFSNFAFQVQMTIIKGAGGGIIFRLNGPKYYYCYIHEDGTYGCSLYVDATSAPKVLVSGSSSVIKTGVKQSNLIAAVASGSSIKLYVNGQLVASMSDNNYSHGSIGVVAEDDSSPAEVVFSNARVWTT